jgi:Ion channel
MSAPRCLQHTRQQVEVAVRTDLVAAAGAAAAAVPTAALPGGAQPHGALAAAAALWHGPSALQQHSITFFGYRISRKSNPHAALGRATTTGKCCTTCHHRRCWLCTCYICIYSWQTSWTASGEPWHRFSIAALGSVLVNCGLVYCAQTHTKHLHHQLSKSHLQVLHGSCRRAGELVAAECGYASRICPIINGTGLLHDLIDNVLLCCELIAGSVSDDLTTASGVTKYIAAFYYVTTFLSTVGFGDITATTDAERIVATIMMFVGEQMEWRASAMPYCQNFENDEQLLMYARASVQVSRSLASCWA